MQAIYLVVLFLIALVVADPPIPDTPDQFQANVKLTMGGIFPQTVAGVYYYDYINQKTRVDQTMFGDTSTTLQDFTTMFQYQYDVAAKRCECTQMKDPMNPASVPYGSTYDGQMTIGTQTVDVWSVLNPAFTAAGLYMTFYVDQNDYVVRINNTISSFMGAQTTLMDLSNYVVGPPAASIFTPPSYCSCPAPPAPATPGTCPGSPGSACQCAQSAQLSFCKAVTYPIGLTIDIQVQDAFVEQAYNALMAVMPNPSAQCQANFQAFLCAFYFPACATGDDVPFSFLPCPDLCPFCGCGTGAGNCTAAPAGITCTNYGTTNYCN